MIEIKDVRVLLPALVLFEEDGEEKSSLFVYIDQIKQDIVIPDDAGIDVEEFKKAFSKYYGLKNVNFKTPKLPKEAINQLNSDKYNGANYGTK